MGWGVDEDDGQVKWFECPRCLRLYRVIIVAREEPTLWAVE